jgi:hypothetical protein
MRDLHRPSREEMLVQRERRERQFWSRGGWFTHYVFFPHEPDALECGRALPHMMPRMYWPQYEPGAGLVLTQRIRDHECRHPAQAVRDAIRDMQAFVRGFSGAWVDNTQAGLGGAHLPTSRAAAKPLGDVGPLFGPPVPIDWLNGGDLDDDAKRFYGDEMAQMYRCVPYMRSLFERRPAQDGE